MALRYPTAIRAKAVKWREDGARLEAIVDMIQAECGRITDAKTLSTQIPRWQADPHVQVALKAVGSRK